MRYYREVLLALLAGAISGALVLGIAGRVTMAGVALINGNSLNLSLKGVLEVVIVGTLVGTVGGGILFAFRSVYRSYGFASGIIVGVILFVSSTFLVVVSGSINFDMSFIQFLTLSFVFTMFMIYGVCASALLQRFKRNWRKY